MGAFTAVDQIWYPDEDDTAEQNVNLSTMATSIEEGIGARLAKQEVTKSLLANLPPGSTVPLVNLTEKVIPFSINGAGFNNGFTLNPAGTVSITTPGVYFFSVSALAGAANVPGFMQVYMKKNNVVNTSTLCNFGYSGNSYIAAGSASAVLVCAAGDTISLTARVSNTTGSLLLSAGGDSSYTILSAALIKAL